MRVVVCGSRTFSDRAVLGNVLLGFYEDRVLGYLLTHGDNEFVVIDGACPYGGADEEAHLWAKASGPHPGPAPSDGHLEGDLVYVETERFPAKANTAFEYHARNRAMIDSGADLCIAFIDKPLVESRGTKYTVEYARSKGVKTVVVEVR